MTIHHAETHETVESQSEAYVDDTSYMINTMILTLRTQTCMQTLWRRDLQKISQHAGITLFATGGALELSKCCWYTLSWKFDAKGAAHTMKISDNPSSIELTSGDDLLNKTQISRIDPTDYVRTFGCYIAPNCSSKKQVEVLLQKARHFKRVMSSPTVSKVNAYNVYRVFFSRYLLSSRGFSDKRKRS